MVEYDFTTKQKHILWDLDGEIIALTKSYPHITHPSLSKYCQQLIKSKFDKRMRLQEKFMKGGGVNVDKEPTD